MPLTTGLPAEWAAHINPKSMAQAGGADGTARQPHREVGAEPVDRVIPACVVDQIKGQRCPLRKLAADQAVHEVSIDIHLSGGRTANGQFNRPFRTDRRPVAGAARSNGGTIVL